MAGTDSNTQMSCSPLIIVELLQACSQVYELVLGSFRVHLDEKILDGTKALRGTQSHIFSFTSLVYGLIFGFSIPQAAFFNQGSLPHHCVTGCADDTGELAQKNHV